MSLTRVDPKNFLWGLWWESLDSYERMIVRPYEAVWHEAFMQYDVSIEDVRMLVREKVREHYAGR